MSGKKNASHSRIVVVPDPAGLALTVAQAILVFIQQGLTHQPFFSLVLSGGSTPKNIYRLLADPARVARLDWGRIQVFFGDERCVPPQHEESNYRMARETFLDHIPLPATNIHRIRGEEPPEEAARDYQKEIEGIFPNAAFPRLDLVLLGMGEDGHIASLFPGSESLNEKSRWVLPVVHDRPPQPLVVSTSTLSQQAAHGEELFKSLGCSACHRIGGVGGSVGPDLTHVGSRRNREWIAEQIKNPKSHDPDSIMPSFSSVSPKDRGDIADYLSGLR